METRIGEVTHYYDHVGVAILELSDKLRDGDLVHIAGHTTNFTQPVESLEIDHHKVHVVEAGQEVALKVIDRVRRHDEVFRVIKEQ